MTVSATLPPVSSAIDGGALQAKAAPVAMTLVNLSPDAIFQIDAAGVICFASAGARRLFAMPSGFNPIGTPIRTWVSPEEGERFTSLLHNAALLHNAPEPDTAEPLQLLLHRYDAIEFGAEVYAAPLPGEAKTDCMSECATAGFALYIRPIADHTVAGALWRQQQEEKRFARRLAILHEVSLELALTPALDALCRRAVELACSRLGFDRLAVFLVDPQQPKVLLGAYGIDEDGRLRDERGRSLNLEDPQQSCWLPLFAASTPLVYFEDDVLVDDCTRPIGRGEHAAAGLWDGNQAIGLMVVDNFLHHAPIDPRQRQILVLYAQMVGHLCTLKRIQAELEAGRNAAESASRAKSLFLASMSHEIRTPMNAVMGMTSLLLDTELAPEQREYVETIRNSSDALLTVINDILDFSKIESGKMDLEVQDFAVAACVEEALDLFASKAADKGLELACRIGPETPECIKGDVTRVRQILVNLIGNAIKFTEHGEIVVEVHREPCPSAEAGTQPETPCFLLHFSVRDTGIGIPADRIERLFQSFTQVDASTTRKYGGTGLGLAISRRLAQLMGGQLWVESRLGAGSTFHFTIATQAASYTPTAVTANLTGRRVLIVDDNHTNCFILQEQLRRWGMESTAVQSGAAALALLDRGETFDLAVLDLHMPEMDGLQLVSLLGRRPPERQFPLVMLTSLGDNYLREQAMKLGCAAFVTKPVKQAHLYDLLAKSLQFVNIPVARPVSAPVFDRSFAERHPLRILLAEDNVVNQKVARQILSKLGYTADIAANGQEAVDALERQPYDLVLMDIQMPEMDGLEATRRIRTALPAGRQPVIIAMTAAATQDDRQASLDAGMNGYISKPIRLDQLIATLEAVIAP